MACICVPCEYKDKNFDNDFINKYLLYTIKLTNSLKLKEWTIEPSEYIDDKIRNEKLNGLKEYFSNFNSSKQYNYFLEIKTLNKIPIINIAKNNKDKSEERFIHLLHIGDKTKSIFLGIFLKAVEDILNEQYELKNKWDIICVTGDIEFIGKNIILNPVKDIDKKFNGEFIETAKKNCDKFFLFLYISKNESEAKSILSVINKITKDNNIINIEVKYFISDTAIYKVVNDIFNLKYIDSLPIKLLDNIQIKLIDYLEIQKKRAFDPIFIYFGYIVTEEFSNIILDMMYDENYRAYFIYGEEHTGKSSTALAIIYNLLMWKIIYGAFWININCKEILIEERLIKNYIKEKIDEQSKFSKNFSKIFEISKDYLFVIDIKDKEGVLNEAKMKYILNAIGNIFEEYSSNMPYLIITSSFKINWEETIGKYTLQKRKVPEIKIEHVAEFIRMYSKAKTDYWEIINTAEESAFNNLIKVLIQKCDNYPKPNIIIETLNDLNNIGIKELIEIEKKKLSEKENIDLKKVPNIISLKEALTYFDNNIKKLINYLVVINSNTINDLSEKTNDEIDQLIEIFIKSPLTCRFLIENNKIIGYWHFFCLKEDEFVRVKMGLIEERKINIQKVEPLSGTGGDYMAYFSMISIIDEYKMINNNFDKLLFSLMETIEEFAKNGIFLIEWFSNSYTDFEKKLWENFELEPIQYYSKCISYYSGYKRIFNSKFMKELLYNKGIYQYQYIMPIIKNMKELYKNKYPPKRLFRSLGKTQAIIFTFDSLIIKYPIGNTSWESIWSKYNLKDYQKMYDRHLINNYEPKKWYKHAELKFIKHKIDKEKLSSIAEKIILIDGIKETFRELNNRNIKIYIISWTISDIIHKVFKFIPRDIIINDIEATEIKYSNGLVTNIIGTKYYFEGKNRYISKLSKKLKISPVDTLFIGNSINDEGVHETGAETLCINPSKGMDITKVDPFGRKVWKNTIHECDDLREIFKFVKPAKEITR